MIWAVAMTDDYLICIYNGFGKCELQFTVECGPNCCINQSIDILNIIELYEFEH